MHLSSIDLELARERQERAISPRPPSRDSSSAASIRRSLGRRVIALGQRIAAEPTLELARSR